MAKDISSPFTPGRPVPLELFVGRTTEIERLREKVRSAVAGRVEVGFVIGERGIGKSSLAAFVRSLCERDLGVLGLHAFLGGVTSLEEMVRRVFDRLVKESVGKSWYERLKEPLGKHVREVGLFGLSFEFDVPKEELSRLVNDFGPALRGLLERLKGEKTGVLLILDDINGLASSEQFANWLKSLVDAISVSQSPLPLCILLVGLEDRRQALIRLQPSLARVFDLVEIRSWSEQETREFFASAFSSVNIQVDEEALDVLAMYAGGLPVLAHEIGDAAFNADDDGRIDAADAVRATVSAAEVVGRKHLEPQVFDSIRSKHYRSILRKIARLTPGEPISRAGILELLSHDERPKLDNFLRKMVQLGVLEKDKEKGRGVYKFSSLLNSIYFRLEARRAEKASAK